MARGKYKLKRLRAQAQTESVKEVQKIIEKSARAASNLGDLLDKYNKADKKGKKKLQAKIDKARKQAKAAANSVLDEQKKALEERLQRELEEKKQKEIEDALKRLGESIRAIDWNGGSNPEDFWEYQDSARAWAEIHVLDSSDVDIVGGVDNIHLY